jgi:predicted transcriptional regulator
VVQYMSDRLALNLTASAVLDALRRRGSIRVTTPATTTGTGQSSLTELVERLERPGLVIRVEDPETGEIGKVGQAGPHNSACWSADFTQSHQARNRIRCAAAISYYTRSSFANCSSRLGQRPCRSQKTSDS